MKIYFIFLLISKIIISNQVCFANTNKCTKCHPITKLCIKCEKNIYAPDDQGGCTNAKKCNTGYNHCLQCKEDETVCRECDIGYFPDENGGCSITDNCEISYQGDCIECKENYILVGRKSYYSSISGYIRLCKPLSSDSFQNCDSIDEERGTCSKCKDGYYLSSVDQECTKVENCAKSSKGTCKKCNYRYYLNEKEQKCYYQGGLFMNCKITIDGTKCDECDDDYFFDGEGKCVYSNYCAEGQEYRCNKCIENYYLTEIGGVCTTEENCYSGRREIGVCTQCTDNFYIDLKDGKCKSNQEDNDLKNCRVAEGKCQECIYGFYLGQDLKCSNTLNCAKSENGTCVQCINNYHLGLDKRCIDVEHCIYSDIYSSCTECEDKYYYDRGTRTCKTIDDITENCGVAYDNTCERCKSGFYINQKDHKCYSNTEPGPYLKCVISNGYYCIECLDDYFVSYIDNKCTMTQDCDLVGEENQCILCSDTYCLDGKSGMCIDNDFIVDVEKLFYFRCNKTNNESTACENCLEGYELRNGLCFDEQHCTERNEDGTCKKCTRTEDEFYEQCLSEVFGCVEGYFDENCLECDDLENLGDCTRCMEGFELDDFSNNCYEIEEDLTKFK